MKCLKFFDVPENGLSIMWFIESYSRFLWQLLIQLCQARWKCSSQGSHVMELPTFTCTPAGRRTWSRRTKSWSHPNSVLTKALDNNRHSNNCKVFVKTGREDPGRGRGYVLYPLNRTPVDTVGRHSNFFPIFSPPPDFQPVLSHL